MSRRIQHDGRLKAHEVLEAIENQQTISQIASEYAANPSSAWIASDRRSERVKQVDSERSSE